MATLASLLEHGYFPRELPPPFTTAMFASWAPGAAATWTAKIRDRWTRCVSHNLARPGGLRRPIRIPHPISFFALAELVSANWVTLRSHTWKHRLSASRPHVQAKAIRAIVPRYRYAELPRLRALRRRGARYLLRTDINQFYPSIYTHSIPWALHTKAAAKAALQTKGKGKTLLGSQLDRALQCMNAGQTVGIPIGPDTSLALAECLLAAVDDQLLQACGPLIRGFRYVDDYELAFATLSDAESVLTTLQSVLASFELILNPRKTSVLELPQPLEDNWSLELSRHSLRGVVAPSGQRNDVIALFSLAFDHADRNPEQSVLRYAVARTRSLDVHSKGWRTFENCLLTAAGADSSTLAVALGALHAVASRGGHQVSRSALAETFESVISRHAPRAQGSEVAWALWGALAWNVGLSAQAAAVVSGMDDSVVALLALDAEARGLFPANALDKSAWSTTVAAPDALVSEHWLLSYEAHQKGWLMSPSVAADPEFSAMLTAGVSFYDPSRNVPQVPAAAAPLPGGQLPDWYG